MEIKIWLDRNDRVSKITIDGKKIDRRVRFKLVFNYWIRDTVTIYRWSNGYKDSITLHALFEIVTYSPP